METNSCLKAALWREYEALQRKANRPRLDSYAWAIEDQLNHFLESIAAESFAPEPEIRTTQLHTLLCNRTKKHSHRTRLLEKYPTSVLIASRSLNPLDELIIGETLAHVGGKSSEQDWRILLTLANGKDYAAVAATENMSTSALKSKVCRLRRRLKE